MTQVVMSKNSARKKPAESTDRQGRTALLVLGMHRSGTSALGGVLARLGAAAPKSLMQPNQHNPRGYWESIEIMRLNDEILRSAGSRWNDWGRFNPDWLESMVSAEFERRIDAAILAEYGDSPLFVLKDPRIAKILPLWLRSFERLGITSKALLPIRHPHEVASSLGERNNFGRNRSLLLWLRHVLDAEKDSRGLGRVFLQYDDLLSDWRSVMSSAAAQLNIKWPKWSDDVEFQISDFLSSELRHHVAKPKLESMGSELDSWVATTYRTMLSFSDGGPQSPEALAILDSVKGDFDRSSGIYAGVVREHENRVEALYAALKERLAAEEAHTAKLSAELSEQRESSGARMMQLEDALRDSHAEREAELLAETHRSQERILQLEMEARQGMERLQQDLETAAIERKSQAIELQASRAQVAELTADIGTLVHRFREMEAEKQREVEAIQEKLDSVVSARATLQSSVESRNGRIREMEAELRAKDVMIEGLNAAHRSETEARDAELRRQSERLLEQDRQMVLLRSQLDSARDELSMRSRELDSIKGERAEVERSLDVRFKEIAKLSKVLIGTKSELRSLHEANTALKSELDTSKATEASLRARLDRAAGELVRLEALEKRLQSIEASRSWGAIKRLNRLLGRGAVARGQAALLSHEVELLKQSGLLDESWYLERYPDVRAAGVAPAEHYLRSGAAELRDPGPGFSTSGYLERYPDTRNSGFNPLLHYIQYGKAEGRIPK